MAGQGTDRLRVVVADGDPQFAESVAATFDDLDRTVATTAATAVDEAVERVCDPVDVPDGVVVGDELQTPVDLLDRLAARTDVPVVLVTDAADDGDTVAAALEAGAVDCFPRTTVPAQYERVADVIAAERPGGSVAADPPDDSGERIVDREYRAMVENVSDRLVVHAPETGEFLAVNDRLCEVLGYDREQILELGVEGISVADEGFPTERAGRLVHGVIESGESEQFEWAVTTSDGETRWLDVEATPGEIGSEPCYFSIIRDITEQKHRERIIRTLHNTTDRIQDAGSRGAVCEAVVDGAETVLDLEMPACWLPDDDGTLEPVTATEAAWEIPGGPGLFDPGSFEHTIYEGDELVVYDPSERWDDTPLGRAFLVPLGDHGLLGAAEPDIEHYDDVILDAARILASHATSALDRIERARELRESERRFRTIADRVDEVIYVASPDMTEVEYVSAGYEGIWGSPIEQLEEKSFSFFEGIRPENRDEYRTKMEQMHADLTAGEPDERYEFEYRVEQSDGEVRWVETTGYPLLNDDGAVDQLVGLVRDVTERKRREQRIEVFNRILRHNLRNHLDVIRSHAETLSDQTTGSHAGRIVTEVDQLAAIGAQARKTDQIVSMEDEPINVDLSEVLHEAVEAMESMRRDVAVTVELPESALLSTNEEAVTVAVESALENAFEHAESAVTVAVEPSPGGYTVTINDDGPGIPAEELVPIEARTETNLQHGTGLGLWQLRWSVDKLNGELSFDTEEGTTVRIAIPDRHESSHSN